MVGNSVATVLFLLIFALIKMQMKLNGNLEKRFKI